MVKKVVQLKEYGNFVNVKNSLLSARDVDDINIKWKNMLNLPQLPFIYRQDSESLKIRAVGVTGIIQIGSVDFEIIPKFLDEYQPEWRSAFWNILLLGSDSLFDSKLTNASSGRDTNFADYIAEMFIDSFYKGSVRGLPRSYRKISKSGFTLRGSLDTSRYANFVVTPWEIPYLSDELSEDTDLARLLRWAAIKLEKVVGNSSTKRTLRFISSDLSHVSNRAPHIIDARRIRLGSQHQGLKKAKDIGIILLESSGLAHLNGDYKLPGFLWNSNVVYENFIYNICSSAAVSQKYSISKREYRFASVIRGIGKELITIPDVVFKDAQNNTIAVVDAKYKKYISDGKPAPADTYQMITAAHVLGCQHVSLIYPVSKNAETTTWKVSSKLSDKSIHLSAIFINLMELSTENGKKKLVDSIINWLNAIY